MKRVGHNQQGFGLVVLLLAVGLIAALAGVGLYVLNANQNTTDAYNRASSLNDDPVAEDKSDNQATSMVGTIFTVKEWGIQATYSGAPSLVYATARTGTTPSMGISSTELEKADKKCTALSGAAGYLERYRANDTIAVDGKDVFVKDYVKDLTDKDYIVINKYYYVLRAPTANCGGSAARDLQDKTTAKLSDLLKDLHSD